MTLGLEVSPPSAGDEKCPRGGRAVRAGFVLVKADGRGTNIGSNPSGRVVKCGRGSLGGLKDVALLFVMKSGRLLVMEVRKVELVCGLRVRFEGLAGGLELKGRVVKFGLVATDMKTAFPEGRSVVEIV